MRWPYLLMARYIYGTSTEAFSRSASGNNPNSSNYIVFLILRFTARFVCTAPRISPKLSGCKHRLENVCTKLRNTRMSCSLRARAAPGRWWPPASAPTKASNLPKLSGSVLLVIAAGGGTSPVSPQSSIGWNPGAGNAWRLVSRAIATNTWRGPQAMSRSKANPERMSGC